MIIRGHKYKKVFNGPSGSWCYEKEETANCKDTTTVTFRLTNKDAANLKSHLRNAVFHTNTGPTIDTDYYDHHFHADPVDLSEAYRVLTEMASQISDKYPSNNYKDDR